MHPLSAQMGYAFQCYLGQCRLLGEAIVGKKRWEQKFRRFCVFGVVAQHTRRTLRAAFALSKRAIAKSRCELCRLIANGEGLELSDIKTGVSDGAANEGATKRSEGVPSATCATHNGCKLHELGSEV